MGRVERTREYQELAGINIFELKDKELRALIVDLNDARKRQLTSVTPSVNQMNQQIELAQHELSARESRNLARLSLAISTVAIIASALSVAL